VIRIERDECLLENSLLFQTRNQSANRAVDAEDRFFHLFAFGAVFVTRRIRRSENRGDESSLVFQLMNDRVSRFFAVVVPRGNKGLSAAPLKHEMVDARGRPTRLLQHLGNRLCGVRPWPADDLIGFSDVLRITRYPSRPRVGARYERCHVGCRDGRKHWLRIRHSRSFRDQLLDVGRLVPLNVVAAKTIRGEKQDVSGLLGTRDAR
jgi:hypothetical protein